MGSFWDRLKHLDVEWVFKELSKPTIALVGKVIAALLLLGVGLAFYFLRESLAPVGAFLLEPLPVPAFVTLLLAVAGSWTVHRLGRRRAKAAHATEATSPKAANGEPSGVLAPPLVSGKADTRSQSLWYEHFGLKWKLTGYFIEKYDDLEVLTSGYAPEHWVLGPYCPKCDRDASKSLDDALNRCPNKGCDQTFNLPTLELMLKVEDLDDLKKIVMVEAQGALRKGEIQNAPGSRAKGDRTVT